MSHGEHPDHLGDLIVEFGPDYFYDYNDERLAFAGFLRGSNRERTERALDELNLLDAGNPTEAALEDALAKAGLAIIMDEGPTPYRDFVGRLRGWLVDSLADPDSQRP